MKEAIIFPVDREVVLLSEYMNYQEYHICEMVILEESNISDKDNNTTIPIVEARNVNYDTFDSIIVLDQEYMRHPFVVDSLKYGKEVLYVEDLEREDLCHLESISIEQRITVPVVYVVGVTPYTEKFYVQLCIRERLIKDGYKVAQIGSKSSSILFGIHSYPRFMSENINETDKIVKFKKYVKYIEMTEAPDIIIIGIPGGIMPVNKKHHFDFGMTAYMISQAVEPDYVIMSMLYCDDYSEEQLESLRQVCRFKFNYEIDSFHLSNTFIDPLSLNDNNLRFVKIGRKQYRNKVKGLYDFLDCNDMNKAYDEMLSKLSSYNVNQIF